MSHYEKIDRLDFNISTGLKENYVFAYHFVEKKSEKVKNTIDEFANLLKKKLSYPM